MLSILIRHEAMGSIARSFQLFKPIQTSSRSLLSFSTEKKPLTAEEQKKLRDELSKFNVEENFPVQKSQALQPGLSTQSAMDEIRARGFLRYRCSYKPPANIGEIVDEVCNDFGLTSEEKNNKIESLDLKANILIKLGRRLNHFVPNAELHYIQCVDDIKNFYSKSVENITEYSRLARDESVPENLAIRENPVRFHPNDLKAVHGGVTAFPGEGGKVFGLRNKRIYRQFRPKQEWYDYEDQTFDHEPVDKGMPWDVEIAKKMDRYLDVKFKKNGFYKIK